MDLEHSRKRTTQSLEMFFFSFCVGPLLGEFELPLSLAVGSPCNQLLGEKLSFPLQRRALGCRLCPLPTAEFSEGTHRAICLFLGGGYKFKPEPLPVIESCCTRGSNLLPSPRSPRMATDGGRFGVEQLPPLSLSLQTLLTLTLGLSQVQH